MHVEPTCGFRNVAAAQLIDPLDVLPTHAISRHWIFRRFDLGIIQRQQCGHDVVGIGGLRQVIHRAELNGIHRGGDIPVAGENDGARVRPAILERGNHIKTVAVIEPHVDHGISRRGLLDLQQPVGDRIRGRNDEAALLQRLRQTLRKRLIVLDDQQRSLTRDFNLGRRVGGLTDQGVHDVTSTIWFRRIVPRGAVQSHRKN